MVRKGGISMKFNKHRMLIPAAIMILALLAGCTKTKGTMGGTTAVPQASAPMTTTAPAEDGMMPDSGADTQAGNGDTQAGGDATQNAPQSTQAVQPVDWLKDFLSVENRITMFSEIREACVLVHENVALAGVKFDEAYQGEMTQRIRDMVAGEIQAADAAIQTVGVTANEEDVARIRELAEQVRSGNAPQDLNEQINAILNNTTTMK